MRHKFYFLSSILIIGILATSISCDSEDAASTTAKYIDDPVITAMVEAAIVNEDTLSGHDISVETVNGVVQLNGFVSSQHEIDRAVQISLDVEGVRSVDAEGVKSADDSMVFR